MNEKIFNVFGGNLVLFRESEIFGHKALFIHDIKDENGDGDGWILNECELPKNSSEAEIILESETLITSLDEIFKSIFSGSEWDLEGCKKLCTLAGLEKEWKESDGETFEKILYKAAEILGVEV